MSGKESEENICSCAGEFEHELEEMRQNLHRLMAYQRSNADWLRGVQNGLNEARLELGRLQEGRTRELGETRNDFTQLEELVSDYRRASDITARQLEKLQAQVDAPAKLAKDYDRVLESLEKRCYNAEVMGATNLQRIDENAATSAREIKELKAEVSTLRADLDAQWRAAAPQKSRLEIVLEFAERNSADVFMFGLLSLAFSLLVCVTVFKVMTAPEAAKVTQREIQAY